MIQCGTWDTGEEIQLTYRKEQRISYQKKEKTCIYDQFPRQVGINRGNFVERVAKKYFEGHGMLLKAITTLSEIEIRAKRWQDSQRFVISSAKQKFVS